MSNKGGLETDLILAQSFNLKIEMDERTHIQRDESVRVEITFNKEEMETLQKAKELLSHQSGGSIKNTILVMAQKTVKNFEIKTKKSTTNVVVEKPRTDLAKKNAAPLKSVTPKLKKEILNRDQCCQYRDPDTRLRCGSKIFLEVDHIRPKFAGGSNETTNLRVLCRNHNQYRYKIGSSKPSHDE